MDATLQKQRHAVNALSPAEYIFSLMITSCNCRQAVQHGGKFILANSLKQL